MPVSCPLLITFLRTVLTSIIVGGAVAVAVSAQQSESVSSTCRLFGRVTGAGGALPGVSVTVLEGDQVREITSTDTDGRYEALVSGSATYTLRAELSGFNRVEQSVATAGGAACAPAVNLELRMAPRQPSTPAPAGLPVASSGGRFQRLTIQQEAPTTDAGFDTAPTAPLLLPAGFGDDSSGDAIAVNGVTVRADNSALGIRGEALARGDIAIPPDIEAAMTSFGPPPGGRGGPPGPGGFPGGFAPAGGPAGPGQAGDGAGADGFGGRGGPGGAGRGGAAFALGGRGLNQSRIQASTNYSFSGSALDANPYELRPGSTSSQKPYTRQTFGTTVGGPLKIPGLLSGSRTNYTVTYNASRGGTLFDQYATVPTEAARSGDFSGLGGAVIDPATGQPFPNNQIPASRQNASALTLLQYFPEPNLSGTSRNYHYTTTTATTSDSVNGRITHNFIGGGGRGGGRAGGFGGGGRQGGGRGGGVPALRTSVAMTAQVQYRRSVSDQTNVFESLGGTRSETSLGVPVGLNITHGRNIHQINVNFSTSSSTSRNRFTDTFDAAGQAGIAGVSTNPFAWGIPSLSFSSITSVRDTTPSSRSDRRLSASYSWARPLRRHQLRFGGDVQFDRNRSETESNANGTFVFTGIYTSGSLSPVSGADFADFLLGLAQQATVQYGPGAVTLRGKSVSLFVNDDWRPRGNLTLTLGLRYELLWPFVEQSGHLVNLDVTPDFTAAAPVEAGGTGLYTGAFPNALLRTDTNNLAPRIGVAWAVAPGTVIRGGYGISYNNGTYAAIARQLASQPPYATTGTALTSLSSALLLENALAGTDTSGTTNTYGIDKNYALGRVQTWNVDVSRTLGTAWQAGVNYNYTRGSMLDTVRAPNRGPDGLRIEGVDPFQWQSSEGRSVLHSATFRLQRRQVRGLGGGITYTLARSRDNAPSIGGGGGVGGSGVVAQNDQDLEAEWALSNFDRRHRFNATINYDLPFGPNRPWLNNGGSLGNLFEGWRVTATLAADAGTPLTARVQGAAGDVSSGINGALRADLTGEPIAVSHPTIDQFFNTAAFAVPATGSFGNSPRNAIIGPGSKQLNAQLSRDVRVGGTRALTIQMRVNNLLNTVNFGSVDTNVNSPTFGQVLSVRSMRSAQVDLRFRF